MLRMYKNFVLFNRHQADSELAARDIYTTIYSGYPRLIGDYYMVCFSTNYPGITDEKAYKDQLENAKKILSKYKINFRICKFKD